MMLLKKIRQHRRDFTAVYKCDHEDCGAEITASGYDDPYFHEEIIPDMVCASCGRKASETAAKSTPDVSPWEVI